MLDRATASHDAFRCRLRGFSLSVGAMMPPMAQIGSDGLKIGQIFGDGMGWDAQLSFGMAWERQNVADLT